MRIMRKFFALAILAMLASFAVIGCGGQKTEEAPATETTPPAENTMMDSTAAGMDSTAAPMDSTMAH